MLVIFTTTEDSVDPFGQYVGRFRSRCKTVAFTHQGLSQVFAQRAKEIAEREGLDGQPLEACVRLVQGCKNKMRQIIQETDAGASRLPRGMGRRD